VLVAFGASCGEQARNRTQSQNESTTHAHSANCSQAPTKDRRKAVPL
jgi:hypothetical protein